MNVTPKYRLIFVPVLLMIFASCGREDEPVLQKDPPEGSAEFFFQRSIRTDSVPERIFYLNKGLTAVKSDMDTILLDLLNNKVWYHRVLKEHDSSLYFVEKLIRAAELQKDSSLLAEGYYRKSQYYLKVNNETERVRNAFEAQKIYKAIGDSSRAGRRLLEVALSQYGLGDHSGSQETAVESLTYLDPQQDSSHVSKSYQLIALIYRLQKHSKDARKEFRNALNFAVATGDSLGILNGLALSYRDEENYDTAIEVYEDIIRDREKLNPTAKARVLDNLAYTRWLRDPGLDVSGELLEAMEIRQEHRDLYGLQASYEHLTKFYMSTEPALARFYAQKQLETSRKQENPRSQMTALKRLVDLEFPAESRVHAREYIRLSDSLREAELQAKNAFAKIRYDEERKQKMISTLETEKAQQELALVRARNEEIMYLSGIMIILLGGSFLIYFLRQRHVREKALEAYNTETRISKKIHDELANDVYNIMTQLETTSDPGVMNKIEHVYQRTRNISRENNDIDTGERYREELLSMLSSYTPGNTRLICKGVHEINWKKISSEKKINLYRALQELMTNMKKHSRAGFVAIIFEKNANSLLIKYSDNGTGADSHKIFVGNGLRNTENRISAVKGCFTFETEKGKGFKAEIKIPA